MKPLDELALLLRPAGGGLHLVSTGLAEQRALQRRLYGVQDDAAIDTRFHDSLAQIAGAKGFILAVPSDVGAGFQRGANLGPQYIRSALLQRNESWSDYLQSKSIVDLGDVFVVPQLLHDEMVSASQLERTRNAIYPHVAASDREALPVSPLSIAERALDLIYSINPTIAPFLLGGDHSIAWPSVVALARVRRDRWGIVQPDAHTDLLAERLGIRYCFATWTFHANELLERDQRVVQVGIRASGRPREYWESTLDVRQFWAEQCLREPAAAIDAIVEHLRTREIGPIYFSNDIDGTDSAWADATGTPEPNGLTPDFLIELLRRLGRDVGVLGGDLVEVAPPLRPKPDSTERTVDLAARYFEELIEATFAQRA